jgi:hypothetical protein
MDPAGMAPAALSYAFRAPAPEPPALPPRDAEPPDCATCGGDGALPIEPIHEDGGVIWSIIPCEDCGGTGLACHPA